MDQNGSFGHDGTGGSAGAGQAGVLREGANQHAVSGRSVFEAAPGAAPSAAESGAAAPATVPSRDGFTGSLAVQVWSL